MKSKECKDCLQKCLQKGGCETDIDELIIYTYGNRKSATDYNNDVISGRVDFSKVKSTIRYVIKFFTHLGIYAAWSQESCRGSGICDAYKNDLLTTEQNPDCQYRESIFDKNTIVYWFRGEEGMEQFIRKKLLKEQGS